MSAVDRGAIVHITTCFLPLMNNRSFPERFERELLQERLPSVVEIGDEARSKWRSTAGVDHASNRVFRNR